MVDITSSFRMMNQVPDASLTYQSQKIGRKHTEKKNTQLQRNCGTIVLEFENPPMFFIRSIAAGVC
jgi:hypothetical protein